MPCYSITMTIAKLLQTELNRVIQEDLVVTKFADFEECLLLLHIVQCNKGCKRYTFPMRIMEGSYLW